MPSLPDRANRYVWTVLFGLWGLHGIFAFWQFVNLPSDPHPFLFGFSPSRLLISVFLLSWILLNLGMAAGAARFVSRFENLLTNTNVRDFVIAAAFLMMIFRASLGILISLWSGQLALQYTAYADRLLPVLNLMAFVSFEILVLGMAANLRSRTQVEFPLRGLLSKWLIVILALGSIAGVVSSTGLGITEVSPGDWSRGLPAVPLLEWQILLACLFCFGVLVIESRGVIARIPHFDIWICVLIWMGAMVIWLVQPIIPNASALAPHEPNFEVYPFIDSQVYDGYAQSILVGNGLGIGSGKIPQRPLYLVFLAFLHVLVGQGYENMIAGQTMVWAMFPVLLYLLGRDFFGRPVGISIALLAILRDYTSNLVSPFTGNLSYSKLYLSEIPTAIFLILFLFIGMRWIRAGFPLFQGFIMGGILGVGMLVRTQLIAALPVLILFALLSDRRRIRPLIRSGLLMAMMVGLVVSPWLWRNWRITGNLIFDDPGSQTANLAMRYSRLSGREVDIMPLSGESSIEYNDRLMRITREAVSSNPKGVAWGITSSFMNHGINNILLFPLRNEIRDFSELWIPTDAFWERWEGTPTLAQRALLAFYVLVFGLGVVAAWQKNGWLGFLPLGVNLLYNLWTSIALLSGQRFMLTMDWSVYLYYMMGLFTLMSGLLLNFGRGSAVVRNWCQSNCISIVPFHSDRTRRHYLVAGLIFLGIGVTLPLSEMVFPERYPNRPQEEVLRELSASSLIDGSGLDQSCFQKIVDGDNLNIVQGRALYPRFYGPGDGEDFTDAVGYKTIDEGRLVFEMVGQAEQRVVFPMDASPDFFPNAADVTVIYGGKGDVWFAFLSQGEAERLYISNLFDAALCK